MNCGWDDLSVKLFSAKFEEGDSFALRSLAARTNKINKNRGNTQSKYCSHHAIIIRVFTCDVYFFGC